jgi:hypothetical protein
LQATNTEQHTVAARKIQRFGLFLNDDTIF